MYIYYIYIFIYVLIHIHIYINIYIYIIYTYIYICIYLCVHVRVGVFLIDQTCLNCCKVLERLNYIMGLAVLKVACNERLLIKKCKLKHFFTSHFFT